MTTARDMVRRSMRLLSLTASGEEPTAEESVDVLTALNRMLAGFQAEGIDFDHVELGFDDPVELLPEDIDAAEHMLAMRIAPEFGATPSPLVIQRAIDGRQALQARYWVAEGAEVDPALWRPLLATDQEIE